MPSLLQKHSWQLADELLSTLVTESEAIVNRRPLSMYPLLWIHWNQNQSLHCRKRFLANEFWTRWRSEIVPRIKKEEKRNLSLFAYYLIYYEKDLCLSSLTEDKHVWGSIICKTVLISYFRLHPLTQVQGCLIILCTYSSRKCCIFTEEFCSGPF